MQRKQKSLTEREQAVLIARLALIESEVATLPELAVRFGVSRHRLGGIERAACRKLNMTIHRRTGQKEVIAVTIKGQRWTYTEALPLLQQMLLVPGSSARIPEKPEMSWEDRYWVLLAAMRLFRPDDEVRNGSHI